MERWRVVRTGLCTYEANCREEQHTLGRSERKPYLPTGIPLYQSLLRADAAAPIPYTALMSGLRSALAVFCEEPPPPPFHCISVCTLSRSPPPGNLLRLEREVLARIRQTLRLSGSALKQCDAAPLPHGRVGPPSRPDSTHLHVVSRLPNERPRRDPAAEPDIGRGQGPDLRGNHRVNQKKRIRKPISALNRVVRPTTFGYVSPMDGTRIDGDFDHTIRKPLPDCLIQVPINTRSIRGRYVPKPCIAL